MDSSLVNKIEKAHRYAQEPDRARFSEFKVSFRGENDCYTVTYKDRVWHCTCDFFLNRSLCSHTMAIERILMPMLPDEDGLVEFTTPSLLTSN